MGENNTLTQQAVTVHPEHAYAIRLLRKDRENRSWKPPATIMNKWIMIHGGANIGGKYSKRVGHDLECIRQMTRVAELAGVPESRLRTITPGPVYAEGSGIVAVTKIIGWDERLPAHGWYLGAEVDGKENFGWILGKTVPLLEPVKCRGAQGIWLVPDDVFAAVRAQLAQIRQNRSDSTVVGVSHD